MKRILVFSLLLMGCAKPNSSGSSNTSIRPTPNAQAQITQTVNCQQHAFEPPLIVDLTENTYSDGSVVQTCTVSLDPTHPEESLPIYVTVQCDQSIPVNQVDYKWLGEPDGSIVFDLDHDCHAP